MGAGLNSEINALPYFPPILLFCHGNGSRVDCKISVVAWFRSGYLVLDRLSSCTGTRLDRISRLLELQLTVYQDELHAKGSTITQLNYQLAQLRLEKQHVYLQMP